MDAGTGGFEGAAPSDRSALPALADLDDLGDFDGFGTFDGFGDFGAFGDFGEPGDRVPSSPAGPAWPDPVAADFLALTSLVPFLPPVAPS
jgi:hypothetical protein